MMYTLQLPLPEQTYKALAKIAEEYNLTPEALLQAWLDEKLEEEREAASYDAAFDSDPTVGRRRAQSFRAS